MQCASKIARLPRPIGEELNRPLDGGEQNKLLLQCLAPQSSDEIKNSSKKV